jgi:ribosomal protein L37AE/L43A
MKRAGTKETVAKVLRLRFHAHECPKCGEAATTREVTFGWMLCKDCASRLWTPKKEAA